MLSEVLWLTAAEGATALSRTILWLPVQTITSVKCCSGLSRLVQVRQRLLLPHMSHCSYSQTQPLA